MKFIFLAAVAAAIPAISALTINTPTGVVQCQPIMLTFGSGQAPYYVSAIPGGQVSAAPLHSWDPTDSQSITWVVNIPSGTAISFIVKDGTGAQAYSDSINVLPSSDTSCLHADANSSTAASGSHVVSSVAASSSHASGSSAQGATATVARTTATQSSSSKAANVANSGDGTHLDVGASAHWLTGAIGLVGAALLA